MWQRHVEGGGYGLGRAANEPSGKLANHGNRTARASQLTNFCPGLLGGEVDQKMLFTGMKVGQHDIHIYCM